MKSIRILLLIFPFFLILIMPFFSKAGEKDAVREWIEEDMDKAVIDRLEEIAGQREKAKIEASKSRIGQLYREAREYLKLKRYDEARERYEKILELNPKEFKAQEYIVKIDEMDELARSKGMEKVTSLQAQEKRYKLRRLSREGAELYRMKRYGEAREKWEEALRYDPDDESLKEWIKRSRMQEIEKAREEMLFEKSLEEKSALSAIDEAYMPKRKEKAGPEKPEEEMITKEEAGKKKLEEMLESIEIELNLEDVDLRRIIDEISARTKINIFVDWTAIKKATGITAGAPAVEKGEGGEAVVKKEELPAESGGIKTMHLDLKIYNPVPLKSILQYLMKITNLKYRVEEHAVLISTPEALEKEEMVVKVYKLKYGMTKIRPVTLKPLGKEEKEE